MTTPRGGRKLVRPFDDGLRAWAEGDRCREAAVELLLRTELLGLLAAYVRHFNRRPPGYPEDAPLTYLSWDDVLEGVDAGHVYLDGEVEVLSRLVGGLLGGEEVVSAAELFGLSPGVRGLVAELLAL